MAKRVLIADDEENIVTALEFLLQRRGYDNERIYEICSALLPEVDAGED